MTLVNDTRLSLHTPSDVAAEVRALRQIVQVFVSVHGSDSLPEELRALASSCAYRLRP